MSITKEFKQLFHESIEEIAELVAREKQHEGDLLSPALRQKNIRHELEANAKLLEKKIHDGLKACILALHQAQDLPIGIDELVQALQKCIESIKTVKDLEELGQSVLSETSWKTQLGISNNCMQTLYQGARVLFENKEYGQAENAFFAICTLDPTQFAYWIGLGHSSFQEKNYSQAINAYCMASAIDTENAWPHIWAANTFEEEKDLENTRMALDEALSLLLPKTPKNRDLIQSLEERVQKIQQRHPRS